MMKARSAKLVAARMAKANPEMHEAAAAPSFSMSLDTSTSSSAQIPQSSVPDPQPPRETSADTSFMIEGPGVSSKTEYDSKDSTPFDDEWAQDLFDDFMPSLTLNDRRMLAVLLMESFRTRQKMRVVDTAREAGSIVGYSDQTVRTL